MPKKEIAERPTKIMVPYASAEGSEMTLTKEGLNRLSRMFGAAPALLHACKEAHKFLLTIGIKREERDETIEVIETAIKEAGAWPEAEPKGRKANQI